MIQPAPKPRARDLGLPFPGMPGPFNAITDVAGVQVGFTTLTDPARGIRTGVTAIIPRQDVNDPRPVRAGHNALNGNGEMTGTHWISDAGYFIGPVYLVTMECVEEALVNAMITGMDVMRANRTLTFRQQPKVANFVPLS